MLIVSVVFFCLFLIHTFLLKKRKLEKMDKKFYEKLNIKEPKITVCKFFTNFASTLFYFLVSIFLFIFIGNRKLVWTIIIGLIINSVIIGTVKHIIRRERPNINQLVNEKGYSYISGHTFSATFFYGLVVCLVFVSSVILPLKIILILLLLTFILFIAYTRIFLGVHYLSDTIGGFLLGVSYLAIYVFCTFELLNIF